MHLRFGAWAFFEFEFCRRMDPSRVWKWALGKTKVGSVLFWCIPSLEVVREWLCLKEWRTQWKKTWVLSLSIACLLWQYMLYNYVLLLCTLQFDWLPNVCTVHPNLLLHVQALMFQGCSFCLESCHNTGYLISVSEEIFYNMSVVILCCVTVIVSFKWCKSDCHNINK